MAGRLDSREIERILSADSFLAIFYHRESAHPERVYLRQPFGKTWKQFTWGQVGEEARRIASALRAKGVGPGDRVGLISKNCAHWIIADLAILMCGAVSVPYYPTLSADSLREVITMSDLKALFVGKLDAWDAQAPGVPPALPMIAFPHYEGNSRVTGAEEWAALVDAHPPMSAPHVPKPSEPFTIIFTSGTTGSPKGVVLTYESPRQIVLNEGREPTYGVLEGAAERILSYLPLNHIAERFGTEVVSITAGSVVSFSESLERFAQNLRDVEPTLFFAVPRIWTKFREGITAKIPEKRLALLLRVPILGGLLRQKLLGALGLGKARLVLSGAAPLAASTFEWFARLGLPIREVYGMSETGGGVTLTALDAPRPGSVGRPLPGATIRLDEETGEVLIGAPWNMTGYFRDEAKTREVMHDGFVHSGDRGRFDDQGNLVIVGRIAEAFKGEKGRYVVPTSVEEHFAGHRLVDQVMVTGRGLPQPLALVCLTEEGQKTPRDELVVPLARLVVELNDVLDTHERLAALVVMKTPFSPDNGLLTPTLKLRRHVVDDRYQHHYESWTAKGPVVFATE
jgi:long-chain acyl-CoA synthetase